MDKGRVKTGVGVTVQGPFLRCFECVNEFRAAIGKNEMIATMHRRRHRIRLLRGGDAEGADQHDRIAVWCDDQLHAVFGMVSIGHINIIGQGRAAEQFANRAYIDNVTGCV